MKFVDFGKKFLEIAKFIDQVQNKRFNRWIESCPRHQQWVIEQKWKIEENRIWSSLATSSFGDGSSRFISWSLFRLFAKERENKIWVFYSENRRGVDMIYWSYQECFIQVSFLAWSCSFVDNCWMCTRSAELLWVDVIGRFPNQNSIHSFYFYRQSSLAFSVLSVGSRRIRDIEYTQTLVCQVTHHITMPIPIFPSQVYTFLSVEWCPM